MESYDDIEIVQQPSNFKRILYKHQLAAVYKLEKLEYNNKIYFNQYDENEYINTKIGIFSDITGYGKTSSVIALILRDKMKWDLSSNYTNSCIKGMLGDGRVMIYNDNKYERLNTTLVIANQSIIKQWKQELSLTTLKYDMITTKSKCLKSNPEDFDVVLCTPTMYNRYTDIYKRYAWKRFIFDEPTHTKIPSMNTIICGFYWFITATPYLLINRNSNRCSNFLYSLFNYNTPSNIFSKLIVKNPDDFVKLSCKLPHVDHRYYKCYQPIVNIVDGFINDNIVTMIQAGDIRSAVRHLGGNESDNIMDLVRQKKMDDLEEIEMKINRYTRRNDTYRVTEWKIKKESVKNAIRELENRFQNALNNNCHICLSKLNKPILLSCCQNLFCGSCILKWLETKNNCPLCRCSISSSNIIYINQEQENDTSNCNQNKTKNQIISEIIKENKDGKFIIFSSYDETFNKITNLCNELNKTISTIQGTTQQRSKIIENFKNGDINIIFLNSNNNGAGINLQETTDIILYHKMKEDLETQIIGRANRIGRDEPLKIHHLI